MSETSSSNASRRDRSMLRAGLDRWLDATVGPHTIGEITSPAATGMSSETLLFDLSYEDGGETVAERCVVRVPPDAADQPVFPSYDLDLQFRLMRLVGERTAAPVPACLWSERDPGFIGAPFIVMRRVDGRVPPDMMPYAFGDNWLFDADPADQRRLQEASVAALADVHRVAGDDAAPLFDTPAGDGSMSPLRRHVEGWRGYYQWVVEQGGQRSPLAEQLLQFLLDTWPAETEARLSWGDARIGNILYEDFGPVAVLDWEMAGIAPREVDLGWMAFMHRFFHDLATQYGFPGMAGFMRMDDLAATYHQATGHEPVDLRWHFAYAAYRHFVIMFRINQRQVAFGLMEAPADADAAVAHAQPVRELIDGTYWNRPDL